VKNFLKDWENRKSMRVFGLSGRMGSGKDTLADILILHGFKKYEYSDVIKEELDKANMKPTRENLRNMGNVMRERYGPDVLSKKIYEKILSDKVENVIVCGIMNIGEVEFFKRMEGFKLVWVEAEEETRKRRVIERDLTKDPNTGEEFKDMDNKELSTGIGEIMEMADFVIINNGTVEELEKKAREVFGI
jgi:dephospho-CoA kinase